MNCPKCNKQVSPDDMLCPHCGEVFGEAEIRCDGYSRNQKSKILCVILGLLFGGLGILDFYLGYTKKGIIKLVLGLFSLGIISEIWSFIDVINILTGRTKCDRYGYPLW